MQQHLIIGESILRHLLTITARQAGGGVHFHSATTLLPANSKIDDLTRKTQSLRRITTETVENQNLDTTV